MPGLGGTRLTYEHAADSASALQEIEPDFIRLRTTVVIPGTPLARLQEEGRFEPLPEIALVKEIRRFLAGLNGLETRLESDHSLNLLMEIRGDLPRDLDRLIGICDRFLELGEEDRHRFILARRLNLVTHLDQRRLQELGPELDSLFRKMEQEGGDAEQLFHELRQRMV
jgi:hypothetical protein